MSPLCTFYLVLVIYNIVRQVSGEPTVYILSGASHIHVYSCAVVATCTIYSVH